MLGTVRARGYGGETRLARSRADGQTTHRGALENRIVMIRGLSFVSFSSDPIAPLIGAAGSGGKLTLIVGAGASMEAGLPSWEALVQRLLTRAARERELLDLEDESAVARWEAEAARDGYLGTVAIVDALAGGERDRWIAEELFRPPIGGAAAGPSDYQPGPISRQVALLAERLGERLRIITLNYDDLLEQALRDAGLTPRAITSSDHRHAAGEIPVFHVHGYFGRDGGPTGQIVLSERDYQDMLTGKSWQDDLVRTALRDSTTVFVGTSLIDPNLIRYLHGAKPAGDDQAFALFVRQGTYAKDVPAAIPPAREAALAARWGALGVKPVFVDHYVDVAQVLYEIARRVELGPRYANLAERAAEWIGVVERDILGTANDAAFVRGQAAFRSLLRSSLDAAVSAVEAVTGESVDETLSCTLWLVDRTGEHLTSWVTTDRLHVERATVDPVSINEHSRWVAVRAFCRGVPLAEPRDVYASRWHFIRGTPLVLDNDRHGRIPVGCLTTSSMLGRDASRLATMDADVQSEFNEALVRQVLRFLDQPFMAA